MVSRQMRQMGGMGGMGRIGGNNKKGGQGGFFGMVQAKTSTLDKTKDKIVFKVRGISGARMELSWFQGWRATLQGLGRC